MQHRAVCLALATALAACVLRPYDDSSGATDSTGTASLSTTSSSASSSTGTPTSSTPGSTSSTGADLSTTAATNPTTDPCPPLPDMVGTNDCDPWVQDCCEGLKCMPYSGDGDNSWESHSCFPVVPDPAGFGELCTVKDSPASGLDTCDKHMICWDVDPNTLTGTCVGMCTGGPDDPGCAQPDHWCFSNGTLSLCFPECDLITQDCDPQWTCVSEYPSMRFFCSPDYSGDAGQVFSECSGLGTCDPGLSCELAEYALECDPMASVCCLPFCDLDDPNTCPGEGQECLPWYDDPAEAASFNTDVGLCRLPSP